MTRVHGHGVGTRGLAAQRASSTHPTASGAPLYFWNWCSRHTGQIDVGHGASTHFQYQSQATPAYPKYPFVGDSTYLSDSAQPHRYYQHKPAPTPAPGASLLSLECPITDVEIPRSRYFHIRAQQRTQTTVRQAQRMQQTQALQMSAVPLIESYQCHQYQRHQPQHQLPSHSHDPYQCHRILPRTHIVTPITPRQVIGHKYQLRLCTLFNLFTTRLDDCIGLCMSICDRHFLVPRIIWSYDFLLCTSRCTYMARGLVVHGAMLGKTNIVCECASVIS